ncbi:MAG: glycogen synthase [Atribacterota bacterium]
MNIIMVATEAYPYAKSGGMGDVVGALLKYLPRQNFHIKLFLPAYSTTLEKYSFQPQQEITFSFGDRMTKVRFLSLPDNDCEIIVVEGEDFFQRDKMYGYGDDLKRFIFFSRAVFEYIVRTQESDFILHCHDWQSALLCAYTKIYWPSYRRKPRKVIFTIHNLAYQGIGSGELFKIVNLPGHFFTHDYLEFYGNINLIKAGLIFSDLITTVSPTYAREIATPEGGEGLDGLIRAIDLRKPIVGIVNGLDEDIFDPEKDPFVKVPYTTQTVEKKGENKKLFLEQYFPERHPDFATLPVISFISRFVEQKGLDLILNDPEMFFRLPLVWFFLGLGDDVYEKALRENARKFCTIRVETRFDEVLAHQAYAASDMLALPSRFEPCGISQMIAMHYGTLPIVRRTGGLIDTVIDYIFNPTLNTGFQFENFRSDEFVLTIRRALDIYNHQTDLWHTIVRNAMTSNFSWGTPIAEYASLYSS